MVAIVLIERPERADLLFIPAAALVSIVPAQLLFRGFREIAAELPAWMSVGLSHMARNPVQYNWLVLLMILVTGVAVLAATIGETFERGRLDSLRYEAGADLRVTGEVANFSRHRSGHCYFTLKDSAAQLRCGMFRREARALPTDPGEGMTLRVFGGLTLYEARGGYQFVVTRLEAEQAEGMWKLAFDRLRRQLSAKA